MRAGDVHSINIKDNDLACQQADNARDIADKEADSIPYIPLTEEEADEFIKTLADHRKQVDRMVQKMYARAARQS